MESTSISALHNSELHPDDLSCFGFSFALMLGLIQINGWQFCRGKEKNLVRISQGHFARLSSEGLSSI